MIYLKSIQGLRRKQCIVISNICSYSSPSYAYNHLLKYKVLQAAFDEWESFPPCDPSKNKSKVRMSYNVDIFLSVSQKLDGDHQSWLDDVNSIIDTFKNRRNSNVWTLCFENLNVIEIDIDPELDIYEPAESSTNINWVHGPNTQFIKSIAAISSGEHGDYDTVFLMEGDVKPRKKFWLDSLMDEANDSNFAILGRCVLPSFDITLSMN